MICRPNVVDGTRPCRKPFRASRRDNFAAWQASFLFRRIIGTAVRSDFLDECEMRHTTTGHIQARLSH
jgi:hypothetical protein